MPGLKRYHTQIGLLSLLIAGGLYTLLALFPGTGDAGLSPAVLSGIWIVLAAVIWWFLASRFGDSLARELNVQATPAVPVPKTGGKTQAAAPMDDTPPSPAQAVQLLAILQREGRFVDFLQEDLDSFDDAQIGAVVRTIHAGCKQALARHVVLEPVYTEDEGSPVQVPVGFDPKAVRLVGDVKGDPPFSGALRHRGWRIKKLDLPRQVEKNPKDQKWVLAPAEVEVQKS